MAQSVFCVKGRMRTVIGAVIGRAEDHGLARPARISVV